MDSSVSSCLRHYGLGCDSLPMDHACACVSHCLVTGGSLVRPCLVACYDAAGLRGRLHTLNGNWVQ